jgi:hypothetical protein
MTTPSALSRSVGRSGIEILDREEWLSSEFPWALRTRMDETKDAGP